MGTETVMVGKKPMMNYVTAVTMCLGKKDVTEVVVKARGRFTSVAIDVAEVSKKVVNEGIKVKDVQIGSSQFKNKDNREVTVSYIEICLVRK